MKRLLLMVACVLVMAGPTVAGSITILNPSFEVPLLEDNATGVAENWIVSSGGVVNHAFPYAPPDGRNVAWVNDGSFSQELTATLTGNTTYTLKSYVGHNPGFPGMPDYAVQLWSFDGVFNTATGHLLMEISGNDPGRGNYGLYEATCFAATGDSHLGQKLLVRLWGVTQVNFDLVSLDASEVPLPPGLLLLGSGLLGLAGWRRFRKG